MTRVGLMQLIFNFFNCVVCVLGVDRSVWFNNVHVNGSTLASLQGYLHLTTTSTSEIQCALQCLKSKECLSFLRDELSGSCSMFRIGVDPNSGEISDLGTVYNKIVSCEDIGYMSLSTSDKCLKWYNSTLTPIEANLSCQSNVGNLFRITSSDMFQEILNITTIIDPTYTYLTIDGNDIAQEDTWLFSDGSAFDTDLLAWDQPDGGTLENCLIVYNGLIHDAPCDPHSFQYICERYLVL